MKKLIALFFVFALCDTTIDVTKANAQTCVYTGSTQRQLAQFCDIENSMSYSFTGLTVSLNNVFKNAVLPTQTGNSGRFLTTNGTTTSWGDGFALPSQTGNANKPLITNGTVPSWGKRQESYSGTTSSAAAPALGLVTFTYSITYAVPPVVTPAFISTNPRENIQMESNTTTGCTFRVILRTEVLGLLPTYAGVGGRQVDILVTER